MGFADGKPNVNIKEYWCLGILLVAIVAICNSCNMGTRDLPDMYAQSPRAEGIHIRQITRAHVTSSMYHF